MRPRAVIGRRDDRRERRRLGTHAAHRELEIDGDVALGAPRQSPLEHLFEGPVGELRRRANAVELLGFLDRAQLLDHAAGSYELNLVTDQLGQARMLLDRHLGVVEPQPPGGEALDRQLEQVRPDLALPLRGDLLGRLREITEVRQEAAQAVATDDRGRVGAGEAGEPADVDQAGDEQAVELALFQHLDDPLGARHPSSCLSRSSAVR